MSFIQFIGELILTINGHNTSVATVAILPNGNIVSGSEYTTIIIWDSTTGAEIRTLMGHTDYVWSVAILSNGNIVSGSEDTTIKIWNSDAG